MSNAARRYAEALIDSIFDGENAAEAGRSAADELSQLAEAIREVPDLRNALENPSYTQDDRLKALEVIAGKLELSARTRSFAKLVIEKGRAAELTEISLVFRKLLDERSGRVIAVVTSAAPLTDAALADIKAALEKRTGKAVDVEAKVDPELIGGIRAEVGTIVFDGSIRSELESLREKLATV